MVNLLKIFVAISKWKTILEIVVLSIIVIFIYQHSCLDYARRDQIFYMIERNHFQSDWSWFMHAINYNRTRLNAPGDYFLFRPAFFLFLAIYDIFLRDNQLITGLTSIILHLSVVVLLYFTFRLHFKNTQALPFAALFASQCVGIEMVVWRHISFYMLSASLTLISLLIILSRLRHKYLLSGIVLLIAMLFHEIVPSSTLLLSFLLIVVIVFRGRSQYQENISVPKLIYIFIAMLFLYFLFDITNLKVTSPPSIIGPADHFSPSWTLFRDAVRNFFLYLGSGTRAVFNPFSMTLTWSKSLDDWAHFFWDIRKDNAQIYFVWAAIGGVLLLIAILVLLSKVFFRKQAPADIITLWACCGVISLTGIFSFFRLTLRNLDYGCFSTYYYWFFSFFYIIIAKFLIDEILKYMPSSWWKKIICFVGYVFMFIIITAQVFKARDLIEKNYDLKWAEQITQAIRTSEKYFILNPDACLDAKKRYLGVPPRKRQFFTLPYYLNKYNCGWVSGTSVVHLYRTNEGVTVIRPGPYPNKPE